MNSGILLVDKPQGITSHDVVARVRKAAGTRKVGHAGTLDPLATGLLVLGLNSSTRLLTFLVGLDKTYEATIRLGVSTASDDSEGEVTSTSDASGVADAAVDAGIADLTGPISQVPTTVSAIKVGGRRAYDLAREGVEVELKARDVVVSEFVVLDRRDAVADGVAVRDLDVRVSCSSGTYVRALARDLGGALGVGGHLTALRRTRVGSFDVADAAVLEGIEVAPALLAPSAVASSLFPVWSMTADEATDLGHGKRPAAGLADTEGPVAAVTASGDLAGLVSVRGGRAVPIVNFPTDEVRA
ncbi:tRNA pseudouridine55 synthase [Frigoribacterium sp. PhB107]|uniref:tRNA pseudouridine(55) synthase TruB n=1 Tax=Frigoribacterium sp. PhB107 TaxID=2485172 RepID=UPI000F4639E6|nr:tRNA pseudouridine(55) synthase TruB [Frigoribacterium sp. PhB107]ROP77955.1 tRNA pseudouridine55 synthase [Frigoribacterium sp. PhB107]